METRGFALELLADTLMTQTDVARERTLTNFQPSRLSLAQRKAQNPTEATDQRRKGSWGLTIELRGRAETQAIHQSNEAHWALRERRIGAAGAQSLPATAATLPSLTVPPTIVRRDF